MTKTPGPFEDIVLEWRGETATIPANRVMGAICRVEEVITLVELQRMAESGAPSISRLACAFASVLRYAGVSVTDEDVYCGMFDGAEQSSIATALQTILMMMLPPKMRQAVETEEKKSPAKATGRRSSPRRSRRPSAEDG